MKTKTVWNRCNLNGTKCQTRKNREGNVTALNLFAHNGGQLAKLTVANGNLTIRLTETGSQRSSLVLGVLCNLLGKKLSG